MTTDKLALVICNIVLVIACIIDTAIIICWYIAGKNKRR